MLEHDSDLFQDRFDFRCDIVIFLQGYRVIALATKELAPSLSYLKVQRMKRDDVER
jgi:hypothetical protein